MAIARFSTPIGRKFVEVNGTTIEAAKRADAPSYGPSSWVQDGRDETYAKREVEAEVAARLAQLDYLYPTQKRRSK